MAFFNSYCPKHPTEPLWQYFVGIDKPPLEECAICSGKYKPNTVVSPYKLLDLINELHPTESLSISHVPVNQVEFKITRTPLDSSKPPIETTGVMPANHHCDMEKIIDLVQFLKKRLDDSDKEGLEKTISDSEYIKDLEGLVCFLAGCYEEAKKIYFDAHMNTSSVSNPNRRDLTEAEQSEWQRFPMIQGSVLQNIVSKIVESKKQPPINIQGLLKRFITPHLK